MQLVEVNGGADTHLQPMEDPTLEQVNVPEGSCEPMLEQVLWQDLWEGPTQKQKSMRRKEQQKRDELATTPTPCPPLLLRGRR